jgi:hypothetical protein
MMASIQMIARYMFERQAVPPSVQIVRKVVRLIRYLNLIDCAVAVDVSAARKLSAVEGKRLRPALLLLS